MAYPTFPSSRFNNITKSDTEILQYDGNAMDCRYVFVGGAGNLAVKNDAGDSITITGIVAGSTIPLVTSQILSTGTTATNIVAFY